MRSELVPGVFFSPGFYMGFWQDIILKRYPSNVVLRHIKFQKHREMWIGSILAASQTKLSKSATGKHVQFFIGLPEDEPSDVDVVFFEEKMLPGGRKASALNRLNFQITRCSLDEGETLLGQVLKKNKPAYKGLIVAVYQYGYRADNQLEDVYRALQKEKVIYPSQIVCVELAERTRSVVFTKDTFGLSQLYPKKGSNLVNLHDKEAFFRNPDVVKRSPDHKSVGTDWKDLGAFELMPPQI